LKTKPMGAVLVPSGTMTRTRLWRKAAGGQAMATTSATWAGATWPLAGSHWANKVFALLLIIARASIRCSSGRDKPPKGHRGRKRNYLKRSTKADPIKENRLLAPGQNLDHAMISAWDFEN
jgi:hypothetical protein